MQSVLSLRLRQAACALGIVAALWAMPAMALDLFARHTVTVHFAGADGKPIAEAEVRVFAPGQPTRPMLTGRTDTAGKFEFSANTDGLWAAEAHGAGEIVRVMVRVGGAEGKGSVSPLWVVGGLLVLLALAVAYRIMRVRGRAPPTPPGSPPQTP